MTDILFQNARLIDPAELTETTGAIAVTDGKITGVYSGGDLPTATEVIDCGGLCLAPGIIDVGVKVGEPGERHKESYASAGRAAAAGGVTTIVTRADTDTTIDSPATWPP